MDNVAQFKHMCYLPYQAGANTEEPFDVDPPVVLLPADEWFFDLPNTMSEMTPWYPSLPEILTSIVSKFLTLEKQDPLHEFLAVLIDSIYQYSDAAWEPGFEDQLPQEIREFHFSYEV